MEVRANYIIVGLFTLGLLLTGVLFTMWIAKQDEGIPMSEFEIHIEESVAGLSVNNDVLFTGVRVGTVTGVKISETQPGSVTVRISIFSDTPVREDSTATLQARGITGISVVSISGGTTYTHLVKVPEGRVGTIPYKSSALNTVVQSVPETLASLNSIMERLEKAFSKENLDNLAKTMESLAEISSALAESKGSLKLILSNSEKASANLAEISSGVKSMVDGLKPGMQSLSKNGLADLRMLLLEARSLVQTMSRISRQIENNPRMFFFGDSAKEYRN